MDDDELRPALSPNKCKKDFTSSSLIVLIVLTWTRRLYSGGQSSTVLAELDINSSAVCNLLAWPERSRYFKPCFLPSC